MKIHSNPNTLNPSILPEDAGGREETYKEIVPLPGPIGVSKTVVYKLLMKERDCHV